MHPAAVIFDFNGTLSDDEDLLFEIFAEMFARHLDWPMTREDYTRGFVGLSDREIVEQALVRTGRSMAVQVLLDERRDRYRDLVACGNPVRGATRSLVAALAASGRRLGIVTGAQRADVDLVLAGVPESRFFDVIVTEEDVRLGKPDPEGFLKAAQELGLEPDRTLVLEDSVAGVRGARAAGMAVIGVAGTQDADRLRAEGIDVVPALSPDLLRRSPFAG